MELTIYNIKGEDTGRKISLNEAVFGIEPNDHAIYLDVKQYLANQRQGTHKTKGRSEVKGSRRKLGRQKGSGIARPGDIKSPIRVGGGTIFGPVPRNYGFKLNKKVKQLARKSALSYKAKDNLITVVDQIEFDAPKTKDMIALTQNLKLADKKALIILANGNKNVYLSARNLARVKVVTVSELNTYKVLDAKNLIITEEAVAAVEQTFKA
ncbi:MAG: 50S ribosomal protein L4 [Paludibacter sp.]|jgi:large subunit ribosomal protein L4|nr:50S ribosomal protein L4 [Bacteroidales bacterium]HOG05307.1 50S ribosomal protein L4 [Paludibacter sp.]